MFYIHFEESVTFVLDKEKIYFLQYVYEEEIELKHLGETDYKELLTRYNFEDDIYCGI